MPDFFDGAPADITWFPPQNDEHKSNLNKFFGNQGAPPKTVGRVPDFLKATQEKYPSVKEWGVVGFCWGGKIVSLLTSQENGHFKVGAECHPAMLDPKDAERVKVPLAILASKDEDANDVKNFEASLKVAKHVETYGDQVHGVSFSNTPERYNRID
jgi:dienelactone hydrolase